MKKLLLTLVVATLAVAASAQNYFFGSFLNVKTVTLSNGVAGVNFTNLLEGVTATTNKVGSIFTNLAGSQVVVASGTGDNVNVFKDVPLSSGLLGQCQYYPVLGTSYAVNDTNRVVTPVDITVTIQAGSGVNAAVGFVVTPVYGGSQRDNRSAGTSEDFTFTFTPTASAVTTWRTNAPIWRWPGAKALRVRSATSTTANTVANARVDIFDLGVSFYRP